MIAANDTGLTYSVVFFDGAGWDAQETHRVGPFASTHDAIEYATEAHEYAKQHGIPWFSTEIVFE